jgi:hypothetical protein
MTAFRKFDPHAFLKREGLTPDSAVTLAALATLAGQPLENEIRATAREALSQRDTGAVPVKSIEPQRDDHTVEHGLDQLGKNQNLTPTPAKVAKLAKVHVPAHNFCNFSSPPAELIENRDELRALLEARRDRFEERAAILEFDDGLSRAEAEAIAHREMATAIYDNTQAEYEANLYASALAALRAKCPAYVPESRWRQAIADATAFISEWRQRAHGLGWTRPDVFGLHPVPERPAANYSRLSRLDSTGLIWLLRGRSVIALTATEAVMRCESGATLTYRRHDRLAPGLVRDSVDNVCGVKDGALAVGKGA